MILAHVSQFVPHTASLAAFFQDQQQAGFSIVDMWHNMGWLPKGVVFVLLIMSVWSLAVMIDRALYFSAARKQSREFAPKVAGALKEGRLDEAIKVADRNKKSHLAEVVTAGLQEFRNYGSGGTVTEEQVEASQRALERSEAIVHAKLKRGLGGLATIGATAPFIGLFGTVIGILDAFQSIATRRPLVSAQLPVVFRKPLSRQLSACLSLSRPLWLSTTSPIVWNRSMWKWTILRANWWTIS